MQKLISELTRLYLSAGAVSPEALAAHVLGNTTLAVKLADDAGQVRAIVIPFRKMNGGDGAQHWSQLCSLANALQTELGLPAPAVSISGADGYGLWLSLEKPVPAAQAQQFLELLGKAYLPDMAIDPGAVLAPVELPPCLNQSSGKWAAFIHPGMGASFADEPGLEMAPPVAGQVAFLEGLHSISGEQLRHAMEVLQPALAASAAAPERTAVSAGLLLKDATLEDIVSFLHSKNIEPTFRHLLPK